MTVQTLLDRQSFDGNSSNKVFGFNFRFFNNSQVFVYLIDESNLTTPVKTLALNTDYTLTGAMSATGGVATLVVAPLTGQRVLIRRILPLIQATSIRNQGAFFPAVHEDAFDYFMMSIQQLAGSIGRLLEFPAADPNTINTLLPSYTLRAGKVLAFDAMGNPQVSNLSLATLEAQPAAAQAAAAAAAASASAAMKWAENPTDIPVIAGMYSAHHWADKSAASASSSASSAAAALVSEQNAAATLAGAVQKTGAQTMAGPLTVTAGITSIPYNKDFTSTQQTWASAGGYNIPHGLGVLPKLVQVTAVCVTAELGYAVGDMLLLSAFGDTNATGNGYGLSVVPDATFINVRVGSGGFGMPINKTTGAGGAAGTTNNWRFIVRAAA